MHPPSAGTVWNGILTRAAQACAAYILQSEPSEGSGSGFQCMVVALVGSSRITNFKRR
jgi:hypothetical protein